MNHNREHKVTEAFVSIANNLVGDFDVIELLNDLTSNCADILDIASAGLLLADERATLHVVAASSEATRALELFQLQRAQGPCLDCYHSGEPVSAANLDDHRHRWPQFVDAAAAAGIVSVHAVPMRLHDFVLGALGLFGTRAGDLSGGDLDLAQALAHVASIAIVRGAPSSEDTAQISEQLSSTLHSRAALEQAKGFLAHRGDLDMDQAFDALRSYARDNQLHLSEVVRQVLTRVLPAERILREMDRVGDTHRPGPTESPGPRV
ncbi:GAF and ANTAR domain-containing protein [Gordonia sp. NPDC058843]|uniref:GAF and ANTAR domain-containing protein n=1 Tax=Gordonia sp. NPDC058843 TaxID=3346648 RepID=UPI0036A91117